MEVKTLKFTAKLLPTLKKLSKAIDSGKINYKPTGLYAKLHMIIDVRNCDAMICIFVAQNTGQNIDIPICNITKDICTETLI